MSIRRFFGWVPILASNLLFQLALLLTVVFVGLEIWLGDAKVRLGAESIRIAVFYVLAALTMAPAMRSFWAKAFSPGHIVTMSVCALSTMIAVHATWAPFKRLEKLPDWLPIEPITSAIIIGIAVAGLGYMVPVSRHRFVRTEPGVASWAAILATGFIAGALTMAFVFTGLTF